MNNPPPGPVSPRNDYSGYRPNQRRVPWLGISLAIAVIVIIVLSAVLITRLTKDDSQTAAPAAPLSTAQAAPPPNSAQPPPSTSSSPSMTCEGYTASVDPGSQPGWHATVSNLGLAYAAPPDWTVAACGVQMGWAKPCPAGQCVVRQFGAVSTIANPACEKQNIALAGVASSKVPDIKAALAEESKTVPLIYTQGGVVPQVEYGPVREFTIGSHPAVQIVAKVSGIGTDACTGPTALHSMVVTNVPNVEGSVVFLISLREGANVQPKADAINEMVKTLRSPA